MFKHVIKFISWLLRTFLRWFFFQDEKERSAKKCPSRGGHLSSEVKLIFDRVHGINRVLITSTTN